MSIEEKELDRVDRLTTSINAIIEQDGKVTDDEEVLFENILENLAHYRLLIANFAVDDVIDEGEQAELEQFKKDIMADARLIAFEDETFSDDERAVLKELRKFQINLEY